MADAGTTTKVQTGIQDINQHFKERDIQEMARRLDVPYVNLINIPLNSDMSNLISHEESKKADAMPFFHSGKKLRLAVLDPHKPETNDLIKKLTDQGYQIVISLCSEESLKSAQKVYFKDQYVKHKEQLVNLIKDEDLGTFSDEIKGLESLRDQIEASTFDVALNYVQVGAYKTHASDIHFQPEEKHVLVRFRVDGILKPVFNLSLGIYEGLIKEIKHFSHLKLNITKKPQDGQYFFMVNDRKINVRVSFLPSHYGETCVMRLLDSEKTFQDFSKLGFEGDALKNMKEAANLPHGMILVTGPTGSGKTTTMYSMLQSVDTQSKKVITLEDPIEYHLDGITQSQVDPDSEYHFSTGLRAILRQDPDIIMLGEIRDLETAETAAQASLTGHLVITTLHTNSAVESIARLVNMGVKSFILAPALDLIIAQRLVRKLCDCAESKPLTESEKQHIQMAIDSMKAKGAYPPAMPDALRHPKGCSKCAGSGYLGQIAIAEVLRFNQQLRDMILENKPMPEVYDYINKHLKMTTLYEDGVMKVVRGMTTLDEIYRVAA